MSEIPPLASTEAVCEASRGIDSKSSRDIVEVLHREDRRAWKALEGALDEIAAFVDEIDGAIRAGGRLLYFGAGTSGRLGVLDASECPPTFGVDPGLVVGVIAGGDQALRRAIEGAEDSPEAGATDAARLEIGESDAVCGIAASGHTPYVRGALEESERRGARLALLTSNTRLDRSLLPPGTRPIVLDVGPEVIAGSTRMKCGTATKMALNMFTTAAMIRLGKVYDNLMIDVVPSNSKLRRRASRLVQTVANVDETEAVEALRKSDGAVKVAIVVASRGCQADEARKLLATHKGLLRAALEAFEG